MGDRLMLTLEEVDILRALADGARKNAAALGRRLEDLNNMVGRGLLERSGKPDSADSTFKITQRGKDELSHYK